MDKDHKHDENQDEQQTVQVDIEHLINRFGHEIGILRGQAIVNEELHKQAVADWEKERRGYKRAIGQLSERVSELEGKLPPTGSAGPKKATAARKR